MGFFYRKEVHELLVHGIVMTDLLDCLVVRLLDIPISSTAGAAVSLVYYGCGRFTAFISDWAAKFSFF